jgi:ATP-dependent Zn protease
MKSVMRTTERVVTQDERKRIVTLRPKGTKLDYNGCGDVIGNGQMVSGSQVASKVFIIIRDVELGKPNMLPKKIRVVTP